MTDIISTGEYRLAKLRALVYAMENGPEIRQYFNEHGICPGKSEKPRTLSA